MKSNVTASAKEGGYETAGVYLSVQCEENNCKSPLTLEGLLAINFSSIVALRVSISSESPKTCRQNRIEYQSIDQNHFVW